MDLEDLKVSLVPDHNFYWKYFNDKFDHHEMKIAKPPARVFPFLNYHIEGLNPDMKYSISLHFEQICERGFEYVRSGWWSFQKPPPKKVQHERGLLSGKEWMQGGFSFILVLITSDFETENESVIPLYTRRKYRPVVSIREEPSPEKPHPPFIECRLDHTEFYTVREIQNKDLRALKVQNQKGMKERKDLLKKTGGEPPIFATCTFNVVATPDLIASISSALHVERHLSIKNDVISNNQIGTPIFRLSRFQDKSFLVSSFLEKNKGTPVNDTIKNTFTSAETSSFVHCTSSRMLCLPAVKMDIMDSKRIEEKSQQAKPESFFKNLPANIEKEQMAMEASKKKTGEHPTAILTPGISPLEVARKQVSLGDDLRNDSDGTPPVLKVTLTPAVEPPRKESLVEKQSDDITDSTPSRVAPNDTLTQSIRQPIFSPTVPHNIGASLFHQTTVQPTHPNHSAMTGHAIPNFGNFIPQPAIVGPQFIFPMMSTQNVHPIAPFHHLFNTNFFPGFSQVFMPSPQLNPHDSGTKKPQ